MGKRGPKPTPTATLKLRGSWLAGLRAGEVEAPKGEPVPPDWFTDAQRQSWAWLSEQLSAMGLLRLADRDAMVLYCEAWCQYVDAVTAIRDKGMIVEGCHGNPVLNPAIRVRKEAWAQVNRAISHFGLSPAARVGLRVEQQPKDKEADGKERFFKTG